MSAIIINSEESLQRTLGDLRSLWFKHRYLRVNIKSGKDRTTPQNSITHAWYGQLARELPEDDELGWKCFCKLHFGVPILRAEDEEFRLQYDGTVKPMTYEQKIVIMKFWPVTSIMTAPQLSAYAEAVQAAMAPRGVRLKYPVARP